MLPITRRISPYNHYNNNNNNIKYIVIHDTGNYKDTAAGNANYFNGGNRGASAHYFVDDISIWQVVEDYNGAWHCGDGKGKYGITNTNSVSIEMCNNGGYISETTIRNALELTKYLMSKYGVPSNKIVRHYDASRKICPNNMSANNWLKWNEFKRRLNSTSVYTPTTSNSSSSSSNIVYGQGGEGGKSYYPVIEIQKMLEKIGYPCGGIDGIWGAKTLAAIKAFQKDCNLNIDGIVGNKTYHKIVSEYNKKVELNTKSNNLYRVRKSWSDSESQVGAYSNLDNAIAEYKKHTGYKVFDFKGNVIYPSSTSSINNTNWIKLDGKTGTVMANSGLNVRQGKSTSSKVLGLLSNGSTVKLYRKEGEWIHIYYPPHGGYVYSKYIKY